MITKDVDVAVVGGGSAGMAAAVSAGKNRANVLIIERNNMLGGILNQCIHDGFGLEILKKSLTGPEYANVYMKKVKKAGIDVMLESFVYDIRADENDNNKIKELFVLNKKGIHVVRAKAVILAMGCRERTRPNIKIPGTRPAGIMTAGVAQHFMNMKNYMPGKRVVIIGSGDVGLIMARRLTLEGAKVLCVTEILPHASGLPRNIAQCLNDFKIPLLLSHTIVNVEGKNRVSSVTIAKVDNKFNPFKGTEKKIKCDTVLLSVGLIPENELSKKAGVKLDRKTGGPVVDAQLETNVPGIFSCGNSLHVHDIVDNVTLESELAGKNAAVYVCRKAQRG